MLDTLDITLEHLEEILLCFTSLFASLFWRQISNNSLQEYIEYALTSARRKCRKFSTLTYFQHTYHNMYVPHLTATGKQLSKVGVR